MLHMRRDALFRTGSVLARIHVAWSHIARGGEHRRQSAADRMHDLRYCCSMMENNSFLQLSLRVSARDDASLAGLDADSAECESVPESGVDVYADPVVPCGARKTSRVYLACCRIDLPSLRRLLSLQD